MKRIILVVIVAVMANMDHGVLANKCREVFMDLGHAARNCTLHIDDIDSDLDRIYAPGDGYKQVFDEWAGYRAHTRHAEATVESLKATGICARMYCFKSRVESYMGTLTDPIPHFCREKTPRHYRRRTRRIDCRGAWTGDEMIVLFCHKAYKPDFLCI